MLRINENLIFTSLDATANCNFYPERSLFLELVILYRLVYIECHVYVHNNIIGIVPSLV